VQGSLQISHQEVLLPSSSIWWRTEALTTSP
jgi:hypothetical protein